MINPANSKKYFIFALFFLMAGWTNFDTLAQNWTERFDRMDELYIKGNYKLARELNHNLQIRIKSKLGPQSAYAAMAYFKQGQYFAAAGYIKEYRKSMNHGFGIARGSSGRNKIDYARICLLGIEGLIRYGDYHMADSLLDQIEEILVTFKNRDQQLEYQKDYFQGMVFEAQGDYKNALSKFEGIDNFMLDQTRQSDFKEQFLSNSLNKYWKFTSFEIKQLERQYANFLTHKATTYWQYGDTIKATEYFTIAKTWIGENISKNDPSYVQNEYLWLTMKRRATPEMDAIEPLEKLIEKFDGSVEKNHDLLLTMRYDLLETLIEKEKILPYKLLKEKLEEINEKYYDDTNIHPDLLVLISWKEPTEHLSPLGRISGAKKILISSKSMPKVHMSRINVLEFLKSNAIEAGLEPETAFYQEQIDTLKRALIGGEEQLKGEIVVD